MILPDNTPPSPSKARAVSLPADEPQDELVAPPPAYPGHSSSSTPVAPIQHGRDVDVEAQTQSQTSETPLIPPVVGPAHHIEQIEPAGRRFLKAFGIALLIYLVAASFTRTFIAGSRHSVHMLPYPKPSDGKVEKCVPVSSFTSSDSLVTLSRASFHLPLSANVLYIFARGNLAHGNIALSSTSDPAIHEDSIRVDITAHSSSSATLQLGNICVLERTPGEKGIAILTPSSYYHPTDNIYLAINVQLPVRKFGALHVRAFETNLPLFSHAITIEDGRVTFGSIHLRSENKAIHSDYLEADNAILQTLNANITGVYRAYGSLLLQTMNHPVSARVTLFHDNKRQAATNLTMRTTNSHINTSINLRSTHTSHTGGSFAVNAYTENGPVVARFNDQPPESTLTLDARTSNAPATVDLSSAYEGEVALATAIGTAEFRLNEKAKDPMYLGRKRTLAIAERTARTLKGRVWWAKDLSKERGKGTGSVSVRSVNAQVLVSA